MLPTLAQAQGGYAGSVLRMGIAARSEAMGRAYTAVGGNPESAFYNPAAVTMMEKRGVDLSLRALSLDRRFAFAGFSAGIRPKSKKDSTSQSDSLKNKPRKGPLGGGLSLSWIHASVNNIEGRDFDGVLYDTFSNNQNIFNFTFGLRVHQKVAIGLTTRILWNRFPRLGDGDVTVGARAFGVDLGAMVTVTEGVWLGGVYKNINASFDWNTDQIYDRGRTTTSPFPKTWRVGLATTRLLDDLLLAADVEGTNVTDPKVYFGADYRVSPKINARLGARNGYPTAGGSYQFSIGKRLTFLHYAFVMQGDDISSEHVFSWSFQF